MLLLIYKILFTTPQVQSPFKTVETPARVKFRDLDSNIHLTNSRYLAYFDLGRADWISQFGFLKVFFKHGVRMVVGSINVAFIRELGAFQAFTIETTCLGWDNKYLYFKQEIVVKGKVHSSALSRTCPIKHGKRAPIEHLLSLLGLEENKGDLPESVILWKKTLGRENTKNT